MRKFLLFLLLSSAAAPVRGQANLTAAAAEWRQFRGTPLLTGTSAAVRPCHAQAPLVVQRRRPDRLVGGDRRRRGVRRRRRWRPGGARPGVGEAALEVRDREPDRRVVARCVRRRGVHRRPRRGGARGQRPRRQAALDVQDRRRNQGLAGGRGRRRPDRLVRHASLRDRRAHRQAALGCRHQGHGPRDRGRARRHDVRHRVRRAVQGDSDRRRERGLPD